MRLSRDWIFVALSVLVVGHVTSAPEEPAFELPVQLIGFPVIIAAVRITNFVKKLAYSLNPQTYTNRVTRSLGFVPRDEELYDIRQVEKSLLAEFGDNVCVYEKICSKYAGYNLVDKEKRPILDWNVIFSQYRFSPSRMKDNYLVSIFLGDIIASPRLCHQLAKRGRACDDSTLLIDKSF